MLRRQSVKTGKMGGGQLDSLNNNGLQRPSKLCHFLTSPCPISLVWVPYVLCIGGFFMSLFLKSKTIDPDPFTQFCQSRIGIIGDWHPPLMAAVWGCLQSGLTAITGVDAPARDARLIWYLHSVLIWTGLFLCLNSQFWKNQKRNEHLAHRSLPDALAWNLRTLYGTIQTHLE